MIRIGASFGKSVAQQHVGARLQYGAAAFARAASVALDVHMASDVINAYRTDASLRNTVMAYDIADSIFASKAAPSEIGIGTAAISLLPHAAPLISRALKSLKPGEKLADETSRTRDLK